MVVATLEEHPLDRFLDPGARGYPSVHGVVSFCGFQGPLRSLRRPHFPAVSERDHGQSRPCVVLDSYVTDRVASSWLRPNRRALTNRPWRTGQAGNLDIRAGADDEADLTSRRLPVLPSDPLILSASSDGPKSLVVGAGRSDTWLAPASCWTPSICPRVDPGKDAPASE